MGYYTLIIETEGFELLDGKKLIEERCDVAIEGEPDIEGMSILEG